MSLQSYEKYSRLFHEYGAYLRGVLAGDARNIEAVCALEISYLEEREPTERSIEPLTMFFYKLDKLP